MKCEICNSGNSTLLYEKYSIVECECGHVYYSQPVDDSEIQKLYQESYFKGEEYLDYLADKKIVLKNFRLRLKKLKKYIKSGRLIEIGSAYGFFLQLANEFFDVKGFEISEAPSTYGRDTLGLDIVTGDYSQIPISPKSVDCFVMYDCIEHLKYPSKFIEKISQEIKDGGILAITTGDIEAKAAKARGENWRMIHPPTHIHYFGQKSITNLLKKNGFEVLEINYPGYWRSFSLTFARLFHPKSFLTKIPGSYYLNTFDIMEVIARKK